MVLFLFDGEFITLIDFLMLSQPCTTMINTAWSWSKILFLCSWIWLVSILLRTSASTFQRAMGVQLFFSPCDISVWYCY